MAYAPLKSNHQGNANQDPDKIAGHTQEDVYG